jgi:hypothetical protein
MAPALLVASLSLFTADFGICTANHYQFDPQAIYANGQYYVFWEDRRFEPTESVTGIYAARVSITGSVIDRDGKLLLLDSVLDPRAAYDGTNFLVVCREGLC